MPSFLAPIFLCCLGLYFTFFRFWHGFDAISGDLGDPRFNAYVLEHTWLWLKGVHASLFDMQMFYPHPNTFAYSDFMLGFAPIYWFFRAIGCEILLSYQWWIVVCAVLNFTSVYLLAKKFFNHTGLLSALAAFIFTFSLPRVTHLGHAQTMGQFFIVISAMGALQWWRDPKSKSGPWLFCTGAVLQFISAFYFFWFWIWTLAIYTFYILKNQERRMTAKAWLNQVPRSSFGLPFLLNALIATPFLYHYALSAKEFGRRDWVSISNTVPRLISWFNLPREHWEWNFVPFKDAIAQLPAPVEHYLSFGLVSWLGMIAALVWCYRKKPDLRFLTIPVITMFIFTITSGRFSAWVLMSYLFPGGAVIRAVGRIQIFMLLFWAILFTAFLSDLFSSSERRKKILAALIVLGFFGENLYVSDWVFSRAQEQTRLNKAVQLIPADCELIVMDAGFAQFGDYANIDAVMLAYQTGRSTMNGYSGHEPKNYRESAAQIPEISRTKKICMLSPPVL